MFHVQTWAGAIQNPKTPFEPPRAQLNAESNCALVCTGPRAKGFGINLPCHLFKALQFLHFMLFAQYMQICASTRLGKKIFTAVEQPVWRLFTSPVAKHFHKAIPTVLDFKNPTQT